jgi:hypothetical protein
MSRHLQEDTVSGTPTGERARSGGAAQADPTVARPAPAGAVSSHPRLSAFRFLLFLFTSPRTWGERRRPPGAVLEARTPMRSIGYAQRG